MGTLEQRIKDFVREQGVEVVGIAGPDRLDGPPSLDPTYTMKGARSIVSFILPMDVGAIDAYLGKKSYVPHNLDQARKNVRVNAIGELVAGYIRSLGHPAASVRANNTYRRSLYPFALHPSFSHRFGAIAAGIGAQGWSGNVMTEEYGAANYIGTVVTSAVLESDAPRYGPRHFIDGWCRKCKMCDKVCAARMFREVEEEYVLLNGELHPRAKRNDINLCNAACFGLHAISPDRRFTSWGFGWIRPWLGKPTDQLSKLEVIGSFLKRAFTRGDSAARFNMIANLGKAYVPENRLNAWLDKHPERLPHRERVEAFKEFGESCGIKGVRSDRLLTCGQCGLVCGPTVKESARRFSLLARSGLAVQNARGEMVVASTYEEANAIYTDRLPDLTAWDILRDLVALVWVMLRNYTGFEPRSFFGGLVYEARRRKAVRLRISGHRGARLASVLPPTVPPSAPVSAPAAAASGTEAPRALA